MSIKQRISKTRGIISDLPQAFEDSSFVTGDSPATLDCKAALGRNAIEGYIKNGGAGNFTVAFSQDGTTYSDEHTMENGEILNFSERSYDSIRITWISDSSYKISVG